jgi:hypothetical protein
VTAAARVVGPRLLGALALVLGFLVAGPALTASAAPAHATAAGSAQTTAATAASAALTASGPRSTAGPVGTAIKACAPAPAPNRPTAGLAGKLAPAHPAADPGDPFTDPDVAIADVYGYSYRWVNYDNGCVPGSSWGPAFVTGVGNFLLAGAASTNALVHSTLGFVVEPTWLQPLDRTITEATETVREGVFAPWITVVLVLVAGTVLAAAARAQVSNAVTSAGWAILVLVATTYVMSYPVSSAQAVDGLIRETVTASARATSSGDTVRDDAAAALSHQMDTINRNSLYAAWLEGTLGSSDSAVAREHGADLFRASHMTWWEAETLDRDPAAGAAIIEEKKALWTDTAAKVESADPLAYQQLTGNQGRWEAAATVTLMTAITMPFLLVAGVFVVIAYTVTRLFIPLAPALGVFGMLELARGWVIGVVGQLGRFLIMGPLYWIGALVNLALVSSVFSAELPFALKVVIALALPLILFKLFRPKNAMPGAGLLKRMGKLSAQSAATKGAVTAGVDDAVVAGATRVAKNDGPVAHSPVPTGDAVQARPALPAGVARTTSTGVSTRATFAAREVLGEAGEPRRPTPGQSPYATGGGATTRRGRYAAAVEEPVVRATSPTEAARPVRQHPALAPGDHADQPSHTGYTEHRATRHAYPASSAEEDLAAPATARVLRAEERVPDGAAEANVWDVEGEEVFVLWRPNGAGSGQHVGAHAAGAER